MKISLMVLAVVLATGCEQNRGGGANSRGSSSGSGERGITSNINAVGSQIGPLGSTSSVPEGSLQGTGRVTHTGTTAELLMKTPAGKPVDGSRQK